MQVEQIGVAAVFPQVGQKFGAASGAGPREEALRQCRKGHAGRSDRAGEERENPHRVAGTLQFAADGGEEIVFRRARQAGNQLDDLHVFRLLFIQYTGDGEKIHLAR